MSVTTKPTAAKKDSVNGSGPKGHASLAEALLAVQQEMPAIEPDSFNPHFKNKFVSLGHLLAKARPILNRHGFVVMQAPCVNDAGAFVLRTRLIHTMGEEVSFDSPLTPTKNDPQGQGSAITYMRRYALAAALAITDQEDDDGNQGSAEQPVEVKPAPRNMIAAADVERLYKMSQAANVKADRAKMKFGELGVAGATSVRTGIALMNPEQALQFEGWLSELPTMQDGEDS